MVFCSCKTLPTETPFPSNNKTPSFTREGPWKLPQGMWEPKQLSPASCSVKGGRGLVISGTSAKWRQSKRNREPSKGRTSDSFATLWGSGVLQISQ